MARIRTIKPEFFRHYDLWLAERDHELPLRVAFEGLWCVSDRSGRFKWRPQELKIEVLPYDDVDFSRVLDALWSRGFVMKYRVDGRDFGYIPSFSRHQVINNKERASDLPEPNNINMLTRDEREPHATLTRDPDRKAEGKGREGEGRDIPTTSGAVAPAGLELPEPQPSDPPSLKSAIFDHGLKWLVGKTGKKSEKLRPLLGKWCKDHGDTEVMAALVEAQRRDPVEPIGWLEGSLRARAAPKGQPPPKITPLGVGG